MAEEIESSPLRRSHTPPRAALRLSPLQCSRHLSQQNGFFLICVLCGMTFKNASRWSQDCWSCPGVSLFQCMFQVSRTFLCMQLGFAVATFCVAWKSWLRSLNGLSTTTLLWQTFWTMADCFWKQMGMPHSTLEASTRYSVSQPFLGQRTFLTWKLLLSTT